MHKFVVVIVEDLDRIGIGNQRSRVCIGSVLKFLDRCISTSMPFDLIFCSETLVSNFGHSSEFLLPGFSKPLLLRRNAIPRARGMALYIKSGFSATRFNKFECGCHEVMVVRVCSRFHNFYIFSLYRNPDLDDTIYDCLLSSMAEIQSLDYKSSFLFLGDFNAHHREWLSSVSPTNCHGHAVHDFADLSGCDQMVESATHNSRNRLDLVLTTVPGVTVVDIIPPLGSSDHCTISCKVTTNAPMPDITFSRKVFIKSRADWVGVRADVQSIRWGDVYGAVCPITHLNQLLTGIISRRIPSKIIKTRMNDKPWFNDTCLQAFRDKQTAYRL